VCVEGVEEVQRPLCVRRAVGAVGSGVAVHGAYSLRVQLCERVYFLGAHLVLGRAPIDALARPGGVVVAGAGGRLRLAQQAAEAGRVGDGWGLEERVLHIPAVSGEGLPDPVEDVVQVYWEDPRAAQEEHLDEGDAEDGGLRGVEGDGGVARGDEGVGDEGRGEGEEDEARPHPGAPHADIDVADD